jgi:hypothetical protein
LQHSIHAKKSVAKIELELHQSRKSFFMFNGEEKFWREKITRRII